ncbi:NAD(P)/FAD-dependent oxidoreductase [Caproiciproducens sp.]
MKAHEIVVIGAGAIGTSVAYHLTKKGYDVALVDSGDLANGTSSHCDAAAMITDKQPGADAALGARSIKYFKELSSELEYDFEFRQNGSLYVCETELEMEVASDYIQKMQTEGYSVHMCDPKELSEREPYLVKDLPGGFWSDICCALNPYLLCYAFVEQGKKMGLTEYTYSPVTGIRLDEKGAVSEVETSKGSIKAKKVINCGGCWAPEIGKMVGVNIPIKPRKGTILVSEGSFPIAYQKVQEFGYMLNKFNYDVKRDVPPVVDEYNVSFTIEPTHANNLLVGSSRNFFGFGTDSEIEVVHAIATRAMRFYPILRDISCIRAYSGVRPFVEEHLPIISKVERVPGYYIAAGHEGDGISMAPITGRLITQIISGEEPELDVVPFSFSRYDQQTAYSS